jgi:hypothetical protein
MLTAALVAQVSWKPVDGDSPDPALLSGRAQLESERRKRQYPQGQPLVLA